MTEREELVKKIISRQPGIPKLDVLYVMQLIEAHIKDHPEKWVRKCPTCEGTGTDDFTSGITVDNCICQTCKGSGLLAVERSGK